MRAADPLHSDLVLRTEPEPAFAARFRPRSLTSRLLILAALLALELVIVSVLLDGATLERARGLPGLIRDWGPWILRAIVGGAAIFVTFVWLKHGGAFERISIQLEHLPVAWRWLPLHALAMAGFAALSTKLYLGGSPTNLWAAGWLAAGLAGIGFAALTALPAHQWVLMIRSGGGLWVYASISIVLACALGNLSRSLWEPASRVTFTLVKFLLQPLGGIVADPQNLTIATGRFRVYISPQCSGLEGAGLILAFSIVWLLLFRRECRFPQSLLLIPAGVVLLFLLNAVRIAALVLIGDAGARQIAVGGFHSQAGWILFNAVAVGFCVTIRNVWWFTKPEFTEHAHGLDSAARYDNPTAAYLIPFLAMAAAGMIAAAASGGFEWLYPLRLIAGAAALWWFRSGYANLNWGISWRAAVAGVAVFVIWIALDRLLGGSPRTGVPPQLAAAAPVIRIAWIALRAGSAIAAVPLAEELAFRGYLMRRLVSADFEAVPLERVTWFALLGSAAIFGVLHSGHRIAGVAAGVIFGGVVKRRGSIGDAVVAHAIANALLAAYVLGFAQWQLW